MNIAKLTLLLGIALSSTAALAQQMIVSPSPESNTSIDLYPEPDAAQQPRPMKVVDAHLPLPVQARQGGFLKVDIDGQSYWIRSAKVRLSRTITANCGALAPLASHNQTASTPGASDDVCGKSH